MKIVQLEPTGIKPEFQQKINQEFKFMGHKIVFHETKPETEEEKLSRAYDADILILSNMPLDRKVLSKCPNIKMISVAFAGVDHIDMEYCHDNNILVSNAADYSTKSVAELTMGMIFSLYRDILWGDTQTRNLKNRQNYLGTELFGKTIGIVGLGRIGQQVAEYSKVFGCNIIAYNRSKKEIPGVNQTTLTEVLEESDIVSIHIPLTEETKGLIGETEINSMKAEAILINTARGPIVDYDALAHALAEDKIAGAALDVYEHEPPIEKDHPILSAPNTLLLPHLGFATREAIDKRSEIIIENIRQWLKNNPQNVM